MTVNVACLPLDGRPVCYDQTEQLARCAGLSLAMPPKQLLGELKHPGHIPALMDWIQQTAPLNPSWIIALDMAVYGGLIPSRVGTESLETLQERFHALLDLVKHPSAFSSILRIPNYNNAEEEPDYWAQYGTALYRYSCQGETDSIPTEVLADFLARRERNFQMNQFYWDALASGQLKTLVFCQDDTGPCGLNVEEAKQFTQKGATVQTGADEVALTMLSHLLTLENKPRIFPVYTAPHGAHVMARYDGQPIGQVVQHQIQACGGLLAETMHDADLCLVVHTPQYRQGDHCLREETDRTIEQLTRAYQMLMDTPSVILADLAYANGSDPLLTSHLIAMQYPWERFYGYAGWNTPGNSLGSALAMGATRWWAEQQNCFSQEAFLTLLWVRLVDDWLYQADARQTLRTMFANTLPTEKILAVTMTPGLEMLRTVFPSTSPLPMHPYFPCNRTFEVAFR